LIKTSFLYLKQAKNHEKWLSTTALSPEFEGPKPVFQNFMLFSVNKNGLNPI
jgi:hypothetical protein